MGKMHKQLNDLNPLRAVLSTTDALGRVTSFRYAAAGRQTESVYAEGTTALRDYDAEGRLISVSDRAGRVTTFNYEVVGRIVATEYPDGTTISSTYDATGRLVARPAGQRIGDHRLVSGVVVRKSRRVAESADHLGVATRRVIDVSRRVAAGAERDCPRGWHYPPRGYDAEGRLIAVTDRAVAPLPPLYRTGSLLTEEVGKS